MPEELMPTTSPDVLDVLVDEHRHVESLLAELRQTLDEDRARDLADLVIATLVRHSVAEEMYVYPVMREFLADGDEAVEHDIAEHQELEELLKQLEDVEVSDERFLRVVDAIETTLSDHVADEETEQFPELRRVVPAERLVELKGKVEAAEKVAPTRPHPRAPHSELFHKTVGTGVGMVDRLKDAFTGRMTS
jgi:hemerythrin superfamily protein